LLYAAANGKYRFGSWKKGWRVPRLTKTVPQYRKHRASGHAVVSIDTRDFHLGPYLSKASLIEYDRLIGEWQVSREQRMNRNRQHGLPRGCQAGEGNEPRFLHDQGRFSARSPMSVCRRVF
jgi:hypothetical protein